MEDYWVPGVNNLKRFDRSDFTEVYLIETDFEAKVEAEFNRMIEAMACPQPA